MSQDSNTILQGQLKQQGLHTTRPQYTNILYGTVVQTDVSIAPLLPEGASSPIPTGMMTVAVAALGNNYVTQPILYPGGIAPNPGTVVAVGFTPNGTPICTTAYAEIGGGGVGVAILTFGFVNGPFGSYYFPGGALSATVAYDPVALSGTFNLNGTLPLQTIEPGGLVVSFGDVSLQGIDLTNSGFNLGFQMIITNLDNSQYLDVFGSTEAPQGGVNQDIFVSRADAGTSNVGADLSYDTTSGNVTTTAGGTFGVVGIAYGYYT